MIKLAIEQLKQTLNYSKPPCQSVAHFSKTVANTEAQLLKVEEQLAELGTRRMELIEKRKHYAEQL
eukprot:14068207-Alexandrium_andersonii.AAC.1